MYSIVIPSNNTARLQAVLNRIHEMEPKLSGHRIIVIDDRPPFTEGGIEFNHWSRDLQFFRVEKPFIFGRNCNLGLEECARRGHDAILMNDDALMETPHGFSMLATTMYKWPELGILSPTVDSVGNHKQAYRSHPSETGAWIAEKRMLCFVCVYIRHAVFAGPNAIRFDERYVDYGMDDDDFSRQALAAGWRLAILDTVRIDHTTLQSAYRGSGAGDFRPNLKRFIQKWGTDNWGKSKEQSQFPECFPY